MLAGGSQRTARRLAYSLLLKLRSGVLVYEGVLTWDGEQDGTLVETLTVLLSLILSPCVSRCIQYRYLGNARTVGGVEASEW